MTTHAGIRLVLVTQAGGHTGGVLEVHVSCMPRVRVSASAVRACASVPLLQLTFGCWRRAAHEMMELVQVLPALVHFLLAVCLCTVFSCAEFIVFPFLISSVTKARRRTSCGVAEDQARGG